MLYYSSVAAAGYGDAGIIFAEHTRKVSLSDHGRIRTTMDIDVILDHEKIDDPSFLKTLNDYGFDANKNDMLGFKERIHVSIFHKKTMFRIDFKGLTQRKSSFRLTR